ncbi:MAG: DUF1549 domain-containing protein [Pirellulaceae bacterium]
MMRQRVYRWKQNIAASNPRGLLWRATLIGIALLSPNFAIAEPDAKQLEFFEREIRPLLIERCYECHSGDERNGGLVVDSKHGLLLGGDSGPAIVEDDVDKSPLIEAVRYTNEAMRMPPDGKLSDAQIASLERWVAMGAPDPRQPATDAQPIEPTGMSVEEGRQFWSLVPVGTPTIPDVQRDDWVQSPIDAFILAELEERGIQPAAPADRRTLLRRVTYDLTGLPPTPSEIDDFLNDTSDDAFANVVERLLQSPAYGQRWGRHWLDVARYSDSNGLDENIAFGNAWRYRDYVVDAFNSDKPFDRFVIEQLAGDLLPEATRQTQTATGFLVLGAKVLAEPDVEKLMMDTVDEQLDTIGKAFMGMSLGCVRCHDHKFDPLRQDDYYALAAIFKSTRTFSGKNTGAIKYWFEYDYTTDEEA